MKVLRVSVLKKIGNLAFFVFLLPQFLVSAELDVKIENDFFGGYNLFVSVKNSDKIEPKSQPECIGAEAMFVGVSRNFSWINGKRSSSLSLQFRIFPAKDGKVVIKPFDVIVDGETYRTKEVSFNAKSHVSRRSIFDEEDDSVIETEIIPRIEFPEKKYYVGDAVCLRYLILSSGDGDISINGLNVAPKSEGFYSKEFILPEASEDVVVNGKKYRAWTAVNFVFVPLKPGDYDIGGGSVIFSFDSGRLFRSFLKRELKFPMKKIKVMPLPGNAPDDFAAVVGSFSLTGEVGKTESRVHSEIPLTLQLKGSGNFFTIKDPVSEKNDNYQIVIKGDEPQIDLKDSVFFGIKKYNVTIIPLKKGRLDNVKIHMSVYDPKVSGYVKLEYSLPDYDIAESKTESPDEEKSVEAVKSDPRIIIFVFIALLIIVSVGLIYLRNKKIVRSDLVNNINDKELEISSVKSDCFTLVDDLKKVSNGKADTQEALKILYKFLSDFNNSGADIKSEKEYLDSVRFGGVKPEAEMLKTIAGKFIKLV